MEDCKPEGANSEIKNERSESDDVELVCPVPVKLHTRMLGTHTRERPYVCCYPGCDSRYYANTHLKINVSTCKEHNIIIVHNS